MRKVMIGAAISLAALGVAFIAPPARADTWDKLTKVTFSDPVEIPGQVLAPGTYWFKLLDSPSDRNIVQIYNADQSKEIAMIMAIPDYRVKPTGKTVITFEERAANSPEAVKAWFYPGDNYGQEFVYPKTRAVELAKQVKQPVPSMPQNLEANTKMPVKSPKEAPAVALKQAPVKAQQPSGEEAEIGTVVQTPPQLLAQNNPPATAPPAKPAQLPKTASDLPLVGLVGLILTSSGLALRFATKRLS